MHQAQGRFVMHSYSHRHFQFWTKYSIPEYRVVTTITVVTSQQISTEAGNAIWTHKPTMVQAVLTLPLQPAAWLEKLNVLKGSALFKAITYAQNQRPYLENYLLNGRCALSNNTAEKAIRPFTVGRKNWLFQTLQKEHLHLLQYKVLLKQQKLMVLTYLLI